MTIPKWPHFDSSQIDVAVDVLSSGAVNSWTGNHTLNFEREFASFASTKYSVALANGSLALSASYLALGLGKGDEIITTPRTFLATSSSAVLLGIKPLFADVDINSGCITANTIAPLISKKTKAISVVHLGGWPADMESICDLANCHGLAVVEDCAQAHGAGINVCENFKPVGSFGSVSAWSFCQDKIITTAGEGGMITTNSEHIWQKIWSFKDHGKSYDAVFNAEHPVGFRWLHDGFGSNFRLTELQSAIGRKQLQALAEWTKIRSRNASILFDALADLPAIRVPLPPRHLTHAWYKFYAYVEPAALANGWSRDRIISEINALGYPLFQVAAVRYI